jgi:hypothetical protein
MVVEARRAEDVDAFVEALEKSGTFRDVLPSEDQLDEEGRLQAVIDGVYEPRVDDTRQPAAGAADGGATR